MMKGAPPGSLGLAAASGWINSQIFVDFMAHFIRCTHSSMDNPSLLIMDNHEAHLSKEALDLAKSSGILILHHRTTSKMQPLDVGVFVPFKKIFNAAIDLFMLRNPGRPVTIYDVAEFIGYAHQRAMIPVNICNAS